MHHYLVKYNLEKTWDDEDWTVNVQIQTDKQTVFLRMKVEVVFL